MPRRERTRTQAAARRLTRRRLPDTGALLVAGLPRLSERLGGVLEGLVTDGLLLPDLLRRAPVPLRRSTDLVALDLRTRGLTVRRPDGGGGPEAGAEGAGAPVAHLVRTGRGAATLSLTLPTQAFGEQAFWEVTRAAPADPPTHQVPTPGGSETPTRTVLRRQAGPSRLVFRLRDGVDEVPYTVEGILAACRDADLVVPATATPPPAPQWIRPPWWLDVELLGRDAALRDRVLLTTSSRLARWTETAVDAGPGGPLLAPSRVVGPSRRSGIIVSRTVEGSLWSRLRADDRLPAWYGRIRRQARPSAPTEDETAIEAPYRLFLAPHVLSAFVHAVAPVTHGGRTELWHSRLAVRPDPAAPATEEPHWLRTVRAVWARTSSGDVDIDDTTYTHDNTPWRMPLDDKDRRDLVVETADPTFEDLRPADAARLHVSALGADLDLHGAWKPGDRQTGVEEWAHRATLGRDQYVRVVYAGFLYPTGHRASLVKVTERRFHDRPGDADPDEATAYLRQRMYVVVREPDLAYDPAAWGVTGTVQRPRDERGWPLARMTVRTRVTPDLDQPSVTQVGARGQSMFCPRVGGADFAFAVTAHDVEGNRLDLSLPLYFVAVENDYSRSKAHLDDLEAAYATSGRHRVDARGQRLALAPSSTPGDTEVAAASLVLTSRRFDAALHRRGWYPRLASLDAVLPSTSVLTGQRTPTTLELAGAYLDAGLPATRGAAHPNRGEVFVSLPTPLPVRFSSGGASSAGTGGFLSPDLSVRGLSRLTGPVAGTDAAVASLTAGTFDPRGFLTATLGGVLPKIFGCIDLVQLLDAAGVDLLGAAGDALAATVPSFVTEALTAADALARDLLRLEAEASAAVAAASAAGPAARARVETALAGARTAAAEVTGDVRALLAAPSAPDVSAAVEAALVALQGHLAGATAALGAAVAELDTVPADLLPGQTTKVVRGLLVQVRDVLARGGDLVDVLRTTLLLAEELRVTFAWSTPLTSWTVFEASRDGRPAVLDVRATVQAKSKAHPQPSADVVCGLRDFSLVLVRPVAEVLRLDFAALEFRARAGAKPDVNVEFAGLAFLGPLSFVEALREVIPLDGFSDPPALEVSERGIAASFSASLPDLAFGVFSLQNLSLSAGFTVPFLGDPLSVRFAFCERESPFLLTVGIFGGGGFFAVTLTPAGLQTLEASFEFGAAIAIDFGVASGGVSVMGGVYFSIDATTGALLVGYLRIQGSVEVLGIVSVSLELLLELRFQPESGKCVGRAVLTLSISVAFFDVSVEIECERKFAGSSGDPVLAQLLGPAAPGGDPEPWFEHCAAFAAVP